MFCVIFLREYVMLVFFFFSSRRRHTRWNCDWSSDVCSSDLIVNPAAPLESEFLDLVQRAKRSQTVFGDGRKSQMEYAQVFEFGEGLQRFLRYARPGALAAWIIGRRGPGSAQIQIGERRQHTQRYQSE